MDPLSIIERCQVCSRSTGLQCRKPRGHETGSDPLHGPVPEELEALNQRTAALAPPRFPDSEPDDSNHPPPVVDPRQTSLF